MGISRHMRNEKGSLSIEFLGILPFYFLFFLFLWQVVASGYALLTLKSATNDGAAVYAMTNDVEQARQVVQDSIGSGGVLVFGSMDITSTNGNGKFKMTVQAEHPLVFMPKQWKETSSFDVKSSASGMVLDP